MHLEPGVRLETFGQGGTSVAFLSEVGGKELSNRRIVINDEEFDALAFKQFHRAKGESLERLIISIITAKAVTLPTNRTR
jgi:SAM-dependent MidA family methyltransferase